MMNEPVVCDQPCTLCDATEARLLSLTDRDNRFLCTVVCIRCGLIRSDPLPREEQLRAFYSTKYRKEYKGISVPKGKHLYSDARTAMRRFRFLAPLL
ncbi:MAG: hypothetical protein JXR85_02640 [Deltaproteobacteria bacterium]|nr:hypothetical protein [Deltaproteobacteria bacterium]